MKNSIVTDDTIRLSANAAPNSLLFESMWPIPHGVSMNSYLIKGEKTAIVDGLCGWDGVPETLFRLLQEVNIKLEDIDWVIVNHMEPDHSGWLEAFRKLRPSFQIIASKRAVPLLERFYGIRENVRAVASGDTLDLGNGHVLAFEAIPNVHWPETMATYDTKTKALFPCDAFGSFGAVSENEPYDDQLTQEQLDFFEQEATRYYANIVGAFSLPTSKALEKVAALDVAIIAPGHGVVWRKNPQKIIDDYTRYVSYSKGPAKPEITLLWSSMYGMTGKAVPSIVAGIESEGVKVHVHRVPDAHLSFVLQSVWQSSGVVIGMPTYEYKMFPPMFAVLDEVFKKKTLNRKAFYFGSYGWSGGALKDLQELCERHKVNWDFLEPVEFIGKPTQSDLDLVRRRGSELASAVKQWCSQG